MVYTTSLLVGRKVRKRLKTLTAKRQRDRQTDRHGDLYRVAWSRLKRVHRWKEKTCVSRLCFPVLNMRIFGILAVLVTTTPTCFRHLSAAEMESYIIYERNIIKRPEKEMRKSETSGGKSVLCDHWDQEVSQGPGGTSDLWLWLLIEKSAVGKERATAGWWEASKPHEG